MKLFILNNKELVFLTEVDDLKEAKKLQRKIKVTLVYTTAFGIMPVDPNKLINLMLSA